MRGSEALACGWRERSMEERNIPTGVVTCCNQEGWRRDLSQGLRCTQCCATTQSEQTLMVPIEAPPFRGFRVNYNILKGDDDEDKDMKKRDGMNLYPGHGRESTFPKLRRSWSRPP